MMKRFVFLHLYPMIASLLFLFMIASNVCLSAVDAAPSYTSTLIALTGRNYSGMTPLALGTGPSINDAGSIAFVIREDAGQQGYVVVHEAGATLRSYPVNRPATLHDCVQINDVDQVIFRQGFEDGLVSHIQRLDNDTGGETIASGSYTPLFEAPFDIVLPYATQNDSGRGLFAADIGQQTVLGTRVGGSGLHDVSPGLTGFPDLYPMIADNDMTVVRWGGAITSPVVRFIDTSLDTANFIAEDADFIAIGQAPGISDDGRVVAFVADHKEKGLGIYLSSFWGSDFTPVKVIGIGPEFSNFSLQPRVGVNLACLQAEKTYNIVYIAFDTSGTMGLYATSVDLTDPAEVVDLGTSSIVRVGDTIDGLPGRVTNIKIYDPVNNNGQGVFWVSSQDGDGSQFQAIVRAFLDSDGDGLSDCWEINGIRDNAGDIILDLPAMGADPYTKDIFVEVDYMGPAPDGHDHKPHKPAIDNAIRAFFKAPVDCQSQDQNQCKGIRLHVDYGSDSVMNPESIDPVLGPTWGDLSRSNTIPHETYLGGLPGSEDCTQDSVARHFVSILDTPGNFTEERRRAFHYMVFVHTRCDGDSSGASLNYRSSRQNMSFVSLAQKYGSNQVGTVWQQTGTFMHEFGHCLGLNHGGSDTINDKPNYLSVMNYAFQLSGLAINENHPDHPGSPYPRAIEGYFDYSRFGPPDLYVLNEDGFLDEFLGLSNLSGLSGYGTTYFCAPGLKTSVDAAVFEIDWNCNNVIESTISADVNGDGIIQTSLTSYNDWQNINYTQGIVGLTAFGADLPPEIIGDELLLSEDAGFPHPYAIEVLPPDHGGIPPGASASLDFVLRNRGTSDDTYSLTAESPMGWLQTTGIPDVVSVAADVDKVVSLSVAVPQNTASGETDRVSLQAASQSNPFLLDIGVVTLTAAPENTCPGDLDRDGDVDEEDLATLAEVFGQTDLSNDLDSDLDMDGKDLYMMANDFNRIDCIP